MSEREQFKIHVGDCLEVMRDLPDSSVDAIVTDPPYGLSFMGKRWDYDVPSVQVWAECLRVLKPGGHLLAFAGTRTQHRMAVRIEDAGFEIRDMIAWVYGSGFPKSLDVSKAIDKQRTEDIAPAAAVAKWLCDRMTERGITRRDLSEHFHAENIAQQWTTHWIDGAVKPRVPSWQQWQELRTWLDLPDDMDAQVWRLNGRKGKPGDNFAEREVVGRSENGIAGGTGKHAGQESAYGFAKEFAITAPATDAARQWQGWGTALKPALEPITVARKPLIGTVAQNVLEHGTGAINVDASRVDGCRWPANLIHDGSDEVVRLFPVTGPSKAVKGASAGKSAGRLGAFSGQAAVTMGHDDNGGNAARFFYCSKASKADRDEGCEGLEAKSRLEDVGNKWTTVDYRDGHERNVMARNHHPTVKPTALMRYLCRLVTPPGGIVLDPFTGSGSTGKAAILEGFRFLGIERDPEYVKIAEARITAVVINRESNKGLFD